MTVLLHKYKIDLDGTVTTEVLFGTTDGVLTQDNLPSDQKNIEQTMALPKPAFKKKSSKVNSFCLTKDLAPLILSSFLSSTAYALATEFNLSIERVKKFIDLSHEQHEHRLPEDQTTFYELCEAIKNRPLDISFSSCDHITLQMIRDYFDPICDTFSCLSPAGLTLSILDDVLTVYSTN